MEKVPQQQNNNNTKNNNFTVESLSLLYVLFTIRLKPDLGLLCPLWLDGVLIRLLLYICSAQSENLDNSRIALRKVRIPKLADRVRILTSRGTIPELSVRKVRIGAK